jgi:lysyl-tRNA synthetase class 2
MTDKTAISPWFSPDKHQDRRGFLVQRNAVLTAVRNWFAAEGFLEVDVPALVLSPGNEAHLHAFKTEIINPDGSRDHRYLHTSPEFACKKLLAAGERQIFSLGHVFRNRERTATHAPEFTMLEWYRAEQPYRKIIEDTLTLVGLAAATTKKPVFNWKGRMCDTASKPQWLTVNDAFIQYAGVDLVSTLSSEGVPDRDILAKVSPVAFGKDESWSDIFSRILVELVEPHLGNGSVTGSMNILHVRPHLRVFVSMIDASLNGLNSMPVAWSWPMDLVS